MGQRVPALQQRTSGIHCHRRLGKQTISRHQKGLDKICEQHLHYQLIKGTDRSMPVISAVWARGRCQVHEQGPHRPIWVFQICAWPACAGCCAATPGPSPVLGTCGIFGFWSDPAGHPSPVVWLDKVPKQCSSHQSLIQPWCAWKGTGFNKLSLRLRKIIDTKGWRKTEDFITTLGIKELFGLTIWNNTKRAHSKKCTKSDSPWH